MLLCYRKLGKWSACGWPEGKHLPFKIVIHTSFCLFIAKKMIRYRINDIDEVKCKRISVYSHSCFFCIEYSDKNRKSEINSCKEAKIPFYQFPTFIRIIEQTAIWESVIHSRFHSKICSYLVRIVCNNFVNIWWCGCNFVFCFSHVCSS